MSKFQLYVKESCETCKLIEPLLAELFDQLDIELVSQDNPQFPPGFPVIYDESLELSYRAEIEIVPTLIEKDAQGEVNRIYGWDKEQWQKIAGFQFAAELPLFRPGCGSRTLDPGMPEKLAARFDAANLKSRRLEFDADDDIEACFDQDWSDGLPVVPPTQVRVMRMLAGTHRDPQEYIGDVPPDYGRCTIEKIALNAVLAGCRPEYLPVVIASVEAVLEDEFCMHGLLATTYFSGPMIVVNGPLSRAIGMNAKGNALGQGNRANATIGRALQLVIRNIGGGKPQQVDRSALGNPGKYTFCFAEDELGSCWESLAVEKGFAAEDSTVTLFAADGVQGIVDQKSRDPDSLCRSFAAALRVVAHPKFVMSSDVFLVVSPEHERVYREAGWSKQDLKDRLTELLMIPGSELVAGAAGITEGLPQSFAEKVMPKFREGGLSIVRAGGSAGMFSAIIAGWVASGPMGSIPVTKRIIV
ncbi:MAG TPA: thioredoxin [Gammaproteobacteria bacterium]|nr:thioredoxin [Gammaproteobacteria bacterium]HIK68588.1 thioredoxin [Pseudomonadales bacterium]